MVCLSSIELTKKCLGVETKLVR
uniref:Uncharacterized protein n=1 Tax=Rhizophora mucronata TaxID=61149 RepID=A0A2P2IMX2_RHIMU